ncbi:amidinotransferase [Candidatus Saccharibacteria bacterium]|nr:amidinotransferase [Candidatus Saccharibacteria bacterium]
MARFNQTVLMSGVDYFDDGQAINPFMIQTEAIDLAKAKAEHDAIRQAFESAGITVKTVPPPAGCQDGVYTANWALVRNGLAVMARLPNARKAEEIYAEHALLNQSLKIIQLPDGLKFSGQGDALPCGDLLFCGSQYRSDVPAQQFVADTLGFRRIQLQTVPLLDSQEIPVTNEVSGWPDSFFYDLDLALSVLKYPEADQKGLIAWCPDAFVPESQQILRQLEDVDKIEVSLDEAKRAFACNLVSTGETVIMNDGALQLTQAIQDHGLKTILLKNPELGKGGGSIRCTSLTLDN